jgi:hypothetical protein
MTLQSDFDKLKAENAYLRAAIAVLDTPAAKGGGQGVNTELVVCYASEDGDAAPSATYVQAGLVSLLLEECELRKQAEAELAAVLGELRAALLDTPAAFGGPQAQGVNDNTQRDAVQAATLMRLTMESMARELRCRPTPETSEGAPC